VEFLLSHKFQLDTPFRTGVPYLSRQEEAEARQRASERQDRSGFVEVSLKQEDTDSLAFVRRVREEIQAWEAEVGVCEPPTLLQSTPLTWHLSDEA
jgi:poly(A)-specific ribonuclease